MRFAPVAETEQDYQDARKELKYRISEAKEKC